METPIDNPGDTLATALKADLTRMGLDQKDLASKLSTPEKNLTEQGLSMWLSRNAVPRKQVKPLLKEMGIGSRVGMWLFRNQQEDFMAFSMANMPLMPLTYEVLEAREREKQVTSGDETTEDEIKRLLFEVPLDFSSDVEYEIGKLRYRFDIATAHMMIEIATIGPGGAPNLLYRALTRLVLVNQLVTNNLTGGMIVINRGGQRKPLTTLQTEAALLGVRFAIVNSPAEAVEVILEWGSPAYYEEN